jgi:hypothetical protein
LNLAIAAQDGMTALMLSAMSDNVVNMRALLLEAGVDAESKEDVQRVIDDADEDAKAAVRARRGHIESNGL